MEGLIKEKANLTDEVERYSHLVEQAELFMGGADPPGTGDSYFLKGFEYLRVQEVTAKLSDESRDGNGSIRIFMDFVEQDDVAKREGLVFPEGVSIFARPGCVIVNALL